MSDTKPPAYEPPTGPGGYPPPQQPQYPPPQGPTVVIQGMNPTMMSATPVQINCPSCGAQIVTRVQYENGTLVWLLFVLLLIFFICASCVPFCIDDVKDAHHYCPNCNALVGIKRRM